MTPAPGHTPTVQLGIFRYFNTGDRFWTPAWDEANQQPRTVAAVQLADGQWHEFGGFVSEAEATTFRLTGHTNMNGD